MASLLVGVEDDELAIRASAGWTREAKPVRAGDVVRAVRWGGEDSHISERDQEQISSFSRELGPSARLALYHGREGRPLGQTATAR